MEQEAGSNGARRRRKEVGGGGEGIEQKKKSQNGRKNLQNFPAKKQKKTQKIMIFSKFSSHFVSKKGHKQSPDLLLSN